MKPSRRKVVLLVLFSVVTYSLYKYSETTYSKNKRYEANQMTAVVTENVITPTKALQKVEKPESIEEFMQRYSAIHEKRNNYTSDMCRLHRKSIPKMNRRPILLVNDKHKMVFCQTPKAGTVSWCRIMLILAKYKTPNDVMNMTAQQVSAAWKKHVKHLSQYSEMRQKLIMDTYTKFTFVRHPFSRLLSAFNDKLSPGKKSYGKFRGVYAKILSSFRWDKRKKSKVVKFEDFINMVIDGNYTRFNDHWREMHTVCYPCDIQYDIIGRFEDMDNDSKYILTLSNVSDLKFPHASGSHLTNSSSQDKINKAFSSLPDSLLTGLYKKFKYDFSIFYYKIPVDLL